METLKLIQCMQTNDHGCLSPEEIRREARRCALESIEQQRSDMRRWGLLADYENAYLTMDAAYEATQLELLWSMLQKGCIYRDLKPVFWSPSSRYALLSDSLGMLMGTTRTALAESELEYVDNHASTSAYVKFPLSCALGNLLVLMSFFARLTNTGEQDIRPKPVYHHHQAFLLRFGRQPHGRCSEIRRLPTVRVFSMFWSVIPRTHVERVFFWSALKLCQGLKRSTGHRLNRSVPPSTLMCFVVRSTQTSLPGRRAQSCRQSSWSPARELG